MNKMNILLSPNVQSILALPYSEYNVKLLRLVRAFDFAVGYANSLVYRYNGITWNYNNVSSIFLQLFG